MILIFLGLPGSGKGTQARLLAEKYNFIHLSTGDLIRREIDDNTAIGIDIRTTVENGDYISDQTILSIVDQNLGNHGNYILDGFPRTLPQAQALDNILNLSKQKIIAIINFVIDKTVVLKRLLGRFLCVDCGTIYNHYFSLPSKLGICDKCGNSNFTARADDSQASITKRLQVFEKMNYNVIEYYQNHNNIINIDSNQTCDIIFNEICLQLKEYKFQKAL